MPFGTGRFTFCCTFLHVAATPRYGAPCPAVFGLSSGRMAHARRSFGLLRPPTYNDIIIFGYYARKIDLVSGWKLSCYRINDPLTMGTIKQPVKSLQLIEHLRRNVNIAALTDGILHDRYRCAADVLFDHVVCF